ncbi:MAG: hypothetical protein KDC05_13170 [Bacteroidales bacterium]|nr:hypothetical protein [Bacteroidales bacterium]
MTFLGYIKKIILFLIPVYIYWVAVFIIDPYEFINVSHWIDSKTKIAAINRSDEASPRGNILWKYIEFNRAPKSHVIFGDSQGRKISVELIREYSGKEYFNFCIPGASYETIIQNFWHAAGKTKLEKVYFQVGFMNYNACRSYSINHFAEDYFKRPFLYFTNREIAFDSYYNLIARITGDIDIVDNKYNKLPYPQLDSLSKNYLNMFFNDYRYPIKIKNELGKIADYCATNNIELSFIILPNYRHVHDYLTAKGLAERELLFKTDLSVLGKVYDFDTDVPENHVRENFIDYFHPRENLLDRCIEKIWKQELAY